MMLADMPYHDYDSEEKDEKKDDEEVIEITSMEQSIAAIEKLKNRRKR